MACYWKTIDRKIEGERATEIKAVRAEMNSKKLEFTRDVLILVGTPEQESVAKMNEEELRIYVEDHIHLALIDDGIATEDDPPEHGDFMPDSE